MAPSCCNGVANDLEIFVVRSLSAIRDERAHPRRIERIGKINRSDAEPIAKRTRE
jgi:hypothetical protein